MFNKTELPNGIRIITESLPHSKVVSVGVWIDAGSRDEHDLNSGSAHFVEHMLFKGTGKRSAQEIAREFDVLGGSANAFTTRENICLHRISACMPLSWTAISPYWWKCLRTC
jgi:predicted Zn-dependent peptidase